MSATARGTFLDALSTSGDIAAAAAKVGIAPSAALALRRRDPAFADGWARAVALGYQLLETMLLERALSPRDGSDGREPIDAALAMKLVALRRERPAATRAPAEGGYATPAETERALMRKLDAIEKRRRGSAA